MEINYNGRGLFRLKPIKFIDTLLIVYIISVIIFSMIPVGNIISRLIGMILFYVFFLFVIIKKNPLIINREIILLLIWLLFCLLSGIVAFNLNLVISKLVTLAQLFFFFIAGYSILISSNVRINTILYLLIISTCGIFIFGFIYQYNPDVLVTKNRITATAGDPNALSILGAFAYIFSLYLFQTEKKKIRLLLLIPIVAIILYGVVLTQSRQGLILVFIGTLVLSVIQIINSYRISENKRSYLYKLILYIFIIIIVFAIAIYLFQQTEYSYRIQAFIAFIKLSFNSSNEHISRIIDYSAYERRQLLKYGFKIWLDHPIFGIGLDNFRAIIKHYNPIGNRLYSHNNYIELLTTIGTFGAIVYYLVYASIFTKLFSLMKRIKTNSVELKKIQLLLTTMICILIIELVTVTYYTKFTWILLLLIVTYTDKLLYPKKTTQHSVIEIFTNK